MLHFKREICLILIGILAICINSTPVFGEELTLTNIIPDQAHSSKGDPVVINIYGTGFSPSAQINLIHEHGTSTNAVITPVSTTELSASFDLAGMPGGDYDLTIINPDGSSSSLSKVFRYNVVKHVESKWNIETIEAEITTTGSGGPTLVIDDKGNELILFTPDHKTLYYAYKNGNTWVNEVVVKAVDGSEILYPSIILDSGQQPQIVYWEYDGSGQSPIYHAYKGQTGWTSTQITTSSGGLSFLIAGTGKTLHICYNRNSQFSYSFYDGSNWNSEKLLDVESNDHFLAVDSLGNPKIICSRVTPLGEKIYIYLQKENGIWEYTEHIPIISDLYGTEIEGFVIDNKGKSFILQSQHIGHWLNLIEFQNSIWKNNFIYYGDSSNYATFYGSLAIDSNDNPVISFSEYNPKTLNNELKLLRLVNSEWEVSTLDNGGPLFLAMDRTNLPYVIYFSGSPTVIKIASGEPVIPGAVLMSSGYYFPLRNEKYQNYITAQSIGNLWSDGKFGWLVDDEEGYITGKIHNGWDIYEDIGNNVYSITSGELYQISYNGWGANNVAIIILHNPESDRPFLGIYGHIKDSSINSNLYNKGYKVSPGEKLGEIGAWDLGNHLHFGVIANPTSDGSVDGVTTGYGRYPNYDNQLNDLHSFVDPINWIETTKPGITEGPDIRVVPWQDSSLDIKDLIITRDPNDDSKLSAKFKLKNYGSDPIHLTKLGVGGRYKQYSWGISDGKLPDTDQYPDFPMISATLDKKDGQNDEVTYSEEYILPKSGDYEFFIYFETDRAINGKNENWYVYKEDGKSISHRYFLSGATISKTVSMIQWFVLCPVNVELIDPDGLILNNTFCSIPNATYEKIDINGDGELDNLLTVVQSKKGQYSILIIPRPEAKPEDKYTVKVVQALNGTYQTIVMADNVTIGNGSTISYTYNSNPIPDSNSCTSITNLANSTYARTYINWTWTDPEDQNFGHIEAYLNNVWICNIWKGTQFYNATGLSPNTEYSFSTHTVSKCGVINDTWVNQSAWTKPIAPIADFSATPRSGPAPLAVKFSENSTGSIISRQWFFGDGTSAQNVTEVTHTYSQPSNYTVTLTVSGPGGEDTISSIISVLTPKEDLQNLIIEIKSLGLPSQIETPLTSILYEAITSLDKGKEKPTINQLNAFIKLVNAQKGKSITKDQAQFLIVSAQDVIEAIMN